MNYQVTIQPTALKMLKTVKDRKVQSKLKASIDRLSIDPEQQGKALTGDLIGYRSLRAVGQRYRIIYQIRENQVLVLVVAVGLRKQEDKKDIYTLAKKLIRQRLI